MDLSNAFEKQNKSFQINPYPSINDRLVNLLIIKRLLQTRAMDLVKAVNQDFSHRSDKETLFLEISPAINAIDYCLKNLKKWTKPQKRQVSWYLKPSEASVIAQPLGVVGIIVPWNYPIYLSIVPLAYAIAAGNNVMVKFSELTPITGNTFNKLFKSLSLSQSVTIINGGVDVAKAFASLPFGHLLFTGSTAVGKDVMAAASKNLTPVTLELGGKSPAIISASVNTKYLERLFMGKLFNAGQTCIAPDYLLIPPDFEPQLEASFAEFINSHYPSLMDNDSYTSLISEHHKERLDQLLLDAKAKGARIVQFGDKQENSRKFPVCLLFNVNNSMRIMQEEIFGPLLPVATYKTFPEAVDVINSMPNPLALYYFGDNKEEINLIQFHTLSGALTINDTIMHLAIDDLPFGGVGQSGLGQYHGYEGFLTFSKLKPLYKQRRISPVSWFYPPYGKLIDYFLRYFAGIKFKENK
ncbi:MAG: coniferyl aldehyde dehydrogenase [Legionella sp.]|nr:coniferyl aldehyde dehydrogenase [Legionella sp.]